MVLNNCHCGISLSDIRFYRRAIRKVDPDIVHIRGAGMESLNAVLGAKLSGRGKILVTVHGMFSDLVYYSPISAGYVGMCGTDDLWPIGWNFMRL